MPPKNPMSKVLKLNPEEYLIKVVLAHPYVLRWKILICLILIASPFFFLTLLLQQGKIGLIIFFSILIIGIFHTVRTFFIWQTNRFYITSQKIIDVDQKSFFHRTVSSSPLEKIIDISYNYHGLWQNLFNFGDLVLIISQGSTKILLQNIPNPAKIHDLINDLIKNIKK